MKKWTNYLKSEAVTVKHLSPIFFFNILYYSFLNAALRMAQ
jgi:hypothetical protein